MLLPPLLLLPMLLFLARCLARLGKHIEGLDKFLVAFDIICIVCAKLSLKATIMGTDNKKEFTTGVATSLGAHAGKFLVLTLGFELGNSRMR
ncbi:hypothetical protein BDP81DRAFT_55825 [Colletotrichum phormii]|uniref:Secreted protein n=1 Tax=Colletotrichum phormii TaxID=359342 RepID=A0AAI9ZM68_9PEZI|nr:uncharacterized protein BDP81DRAFT_55825 [Colletotrichum phormii]KAK1634221.1 hypothetical protein BDP81DRAFT_55825 [Colletotrichum phormii]